jgi:hypothetical protein
LGHKEAITRERKLQRRYDYVERGARCWEDWKKMLETLKVKGENITKIQWNLWFAKCWIEQYDTLDATIKTNALLYQAPICIVTHEICKFNMHPTIKKQKE